MPKIEIEISLDSLRKYQKQTENDSEIQALAILGYHAKMGVLKELQSEFEIKAKEVNMACYGI